MQKILHNWNYSILRHHREVVLPGLHCMPPVPGLISIITIKAGQPGSLHITNSRNALTQRTTVSEFSKQKKTKRKKPQTYIQEPSGCYFRTSCLIYVLARETSWVNLLLFGSSLFHSRCQLRYRGNCTVSNYHFLIKKKE